MANMANMALTHSLFGPATFHGASILSAPVSVVPTCEHAFEWRSFIFGHVENPLKEQYKLVKELFEQQLSEIAETSAGKYLDASSDFVGVDEEDKLKCDEGFEPGDNLAYDDVAEWWKRMEYLGASASENPLQLEPCLAYLNDCAFLMC